MSTRDLTRILVPVIIGIIVITIIVVALYFPPSGTLVCYLSSAPGDPHADYTYTVRFKMWKANDLEVKQIIKSEDKNLLTRFEEQSKAVKSKYESLSYYKRSVKKDSSSLTSITNINYQKIDYDALELVEGTKVNKETRSIRKIKKNYQEIGAKCSYR